MTPLPKDTLDRISDIIAKFESSELAEAKFIPATQTQANPKQNET